jgi:hypothetical protein
MIDPVLKRIGVDPATIRRSLFLSSTRNESTGRTLAVMGKQRYGRRGLPRVLCDQMYADYLRLGSIAAIAPIYGRSRQAIWEILSAHGYDLKPSSIARCKPAPVIFDGVKYSLSGKNQQMRATTGKRGMLRRAVWEKANGPLPRGWNVTAKDGNPMNCDLENLLSGPKGEIVRHICLARHGRAGETKEESRERKLKRGLEYYRQRRDGFMAAGLRSDGKPRRRRVMTDDERADLRRERNLAKWQRRAERLATAGLTTRGTAPVYRTRKRLSEMELAYAALKADMEQAGPRELPVACGFRDTELNQRCADAGRANKANFKNFKLKEAA